jgi:hypothetical protein
VFLRNVGWFPPDYTELYPRRWESLLALHKPPRRFKSRNDTVTRGILSSLSVNIWCFSHDRRNVSETLDCFHSALPKGAILRVKKFFIIIPTLSLQHECFPNFPLCLQTCNETRHCKNHRNIRCYHSISCGSEGLERSYFKNIRRLFLGEDNNSLVRILAWDISCSHYVVIKQYLFKFSEERKRDIVYSYRLLRLACLSP